MCGPFNRLQHGVGGVEWDGDVVRSERANTKMSCAHHMPLHTQEIGKKRQFVCDLVKKSPGGGGGHVSSFERGGGALA